MPFAPHFPVLLRTEDGVRIDAAHTDPTGPSGRDVGIVVAVVMVVGGVALCAFGLTRRDIGR